MERVRAIMSHPDFERYISLNKELEAHREFCCHQMEHALDVARIYYILYLESRNNTPGLEGLDINQAKEIIYATSLLHDIGRRSQYQNKALDHAREGAALAEPILKEAGFNEKEIEIILDAIGEHRNPHTVGLGKILYRADKLSRNCAQCKAREKCYKLSEMEAKNGLVY